LDVRTVGKLAGLEVHAGLDPRFAEFLVSMPEAEIEIRFATEEWNSVEPASVVQRLERRIQHLDATLSDIRSDQAVATSEAEKARIRIGLPFEHENDLHRLQRRQREINEVLVPAPDSPDLGEPTAPQRMAERLAALDRTTSHSPPAARTR